MSVATATGVVSTRPRRMNSRSRLTTAPARSTCAIASPAAFAAACRVGRSLLGGAPRQPREVADRGQRLVDLVRHRRGKLAHCGKPRGAVQRVLMHPQLRLRAVLLRHKHADRKPRHRKHHHQRLIGHDICPPCRGP